MLIPLAETVRKPAASGVTAVRDTMTASAVSGTPAPPKSTRLIWWAPSAPPLPRVSSTRAGASGVYWPVVVK